ncbi:MAG: ferritin-like domain-containing protein [Actinobacteria bacterium]|nr:ferritin-like domain-containing protein [Actinomycetota bacterium]
MNRTAFIQVLGAVAYGERKAYEGARARAADAPSEEERQAWRQIAAEELRHHKGFVRRLKDLEADPERAMKPYEPALDRYHGKPPEKGVTAAVHSYLGEGIADDLLRWLRQVVDPETAAFIDTVIEDEKGHEARALAAVREQIAASPGGRREAARAARSMVLQMAGSGGGDIMSFRAFLALGKPHELLFNLSSGYLRRVQSLGLGPLGFLANAA